MKSIFRAQHTNVFRLLLLFMMTAPCFVFPFQTTEAAQLSPVAMVTDMIGDVTKLEPNSGSSAISLLDQLQAGNRLALNAGAFVVLVYLESGLEIRVTGPGRIQIGAQDVSVSHGAQQQRKQIHYKGMAGQRLRIDPVQTQIAGIVMRNAPRPSIALDNLQDTSTLSPHPVFRWHTTAAATVFHFKLKNQQGKTIYAQRSNAMVLKLPKDIIIESNQPYTWSVQAQFANGGNDSDSGEFTLLPISLRNQVAGRQPSKAASFSDHVVYALWLEQHNLFDAAVQQWQTLSRLRPENKLLQQLKQP